MNWFKRKQPQEIDQVPLDVRVANLKDEFERLDVEMHNFQVRINQALKVLTERIQNNEQRNFDD